MRARITSLGLVLGVLAAFSCVSDPPTAGPAPADGGTDATAGDAGGDDAGGPSGFTLTPGSFHFAPQLPAHTGDGAGFVLKNTGTAKSDPLADATITGPNAAAFTIINDGCKGTALVPGGTCTVTVGFVPPALGDDQATLTVATTTASLTGTGSNYVVEANTFSQTLNAVYGDGIMTRLGGDQGLIALRSGAGTWVKDTTPSTAVDIHAISGASGTYLIATGFDHVSMHMSVIELPSGGNSWTNSALPGADVPPDGVSIATYTGSSQTSYVLGPNGGYYVFSSSPPVKVLYVAAPGADAASAPMLHAVSADSAGNLCAVGDNGRAVAYAQGGGLWSEYTTGSKTLHGVWTKPNNSMTLVVGEAGTLLRSSNCANAWTAEVLPAWPVPSAPPALRAVYGAASGDVYAVGDHGTILRLAPTAGWTSEPSGTDQDLKSVWVSADGKDVYVVAAKFILHKHTS